MEDQEKQPIPSPRVSPSSSPSTSLPSKSPSSSPSASPSASPSTSPSTSLPSKSASNPTITVNVTEMTTDESVGGAAATSSTADVTHACSLVPDAQSADASIKDFEDVKYEVEETEAEEFEVFEDAISEAEEMEAEEYEEIESGRFEDSVEIPQRKGKGNGTAAGKGRGKSHGTRKGRGKGKPNSGNRLLREVQGRSNQDLLAGIQRAADIERAKCDAAQAMFDRLEIDGKVAQAQQDVEIKKKRTKIVQESQEGITERVHMMDELRRSILKQEIEEINKNIAQSTEIIQMYNNFKLSSRCRLDSSNITTDPSRLSEINKKYITFDRSLFQPQMFEVTPGKLNTIVDSIKKEFTDHVRKIGMSELDLQAKLNSIDRMKYTSQFSNDYQSGLLVENDTEGCDGNISRLFVWTLDFDSTGSEGDGLVMVHTGYMYIRTPDTNEVSYQELIDFVKVQVHAGFFEIATIGVEKYTSQKEEQLVNLRQLKDQEEQFHDMQ